MAFDNPKANMIKQNLLYSYQVQAQQKSSSRGMDLSTPMIDRVYKARPGCSACGK